MGELGQFDLEFTLEGAGALGEDVENQAGAVQYPALEETLQVAFLGRRQGVVEDHQLCLSGLHQQLEFLRLTRAYEEARVRPGSATAEFADNLGMNLGEVMQAKIARNDVRYPVEKSRGNNLKYSEL